MLKLTDITDDTVQRHTIELGDETITMVLRYLPTVESWYFDVTYRNITKYGFKLALGVLHLNNYNWPFDIVILDTFNAGIDPFKADDFLTGRIELYMLEPDDMSEIRGYDVEI